MLEGVLKDCTGKEINSGKTVSILGMLEGVLKVITIDLCRSDYKSFNPWYVGGGVKSHCGKQLCLDH